MIIKKNSMKFFIIILSIFNYLCFSHDLLNKLTTSEEKLIQNIISNSKVIHQAFIKEKDALKNKIKTLNSEDKKPLNFLEFAINNDVTDVKLSEIDDNKENAKYIICSQIKKQGKQKSFCEEKFLNSEEGEKIVVGCFTNFCEVCCEPFDNKECLSLCHKTHLDKTIKNILDPEEIFINVCSSDSLGNSMSPFCNKFYGNSLTALKLCQHSFCYDCCVSELKINDEQDEEVKKCTTNCIRTVRESKGKYQISQDMSDDEETDEKYQEENNINIKNEKNIEPDIQKLDNIEPNIQKLDESKIIKTDNEETNNIKCSYKNGNNQIFCENNFDPNSKDYRKQTKDVCLKYFCPLCCEMNFQGLEILSCQKNCHNTQDPIKNLNALKNISPYSFKIDENQSNMEYDLTQDEISYLSSLCKAVEGNDCFDELCNLTCTKLWGMESIDNCVHLCKKKLNDNQVNHSNNKALEIMSEFLKKNIEKIYNRKKLVINDNNRTTEEKIKEAEKLIQVEKVNLINLQDNLLKLQKLKTLEIRKKFTIKNK